MKMPVSLFVYILSANSFAHYSYSFVILYIAVVYRIEYFLLLKGQN